MFLICFHFLTRAVNLIAMQNILTQFTDYSTILPVTIGFVLGGLIIGMIFFLSRQRITFENGEYKKEIEELKTQLSEISDQYHDTKSDLIRTQAQRDSLKDLMESRKEDQKSMEMRFENLSNKIFEEKTKKFKEESQENIGQLLSPLREKINDFHKKVDESFGNQAKEQFSLKEQIKNIVDVHEKMTIQTESLTKALKSDSKAQGNWGEIILEKILQDSGLQKGIDYITQGAGLGLKHPETGGQLKPDIVLHLPDEKHLVIDSKVSLTAYERFCSEEDEIARTQDLKNFLASVRKHVTDLEQRRYQDTENLGTPEIVLMFMPIEGAFMLALQQDRDLHQFAWDKKVAIVCPSTLFATLKTISSLWRLAKQNQNAQEIADKGGALYDKVAGFVEDMQTLGRQITTAENTYKKTMNKLSEGQGNILRRTEQLKSLGAKTSKTLPNEYINDFETDDPDQDPDSPAIEQQ